MRLTLRTLLAWLDDTLPPTQVREIGNQVAEAPLARELVERIQRVTRQRRLTVPSKTGSEATDPNIVAGYLDNDLDAEAVAEYEKKCLTSDVNLAEAASVHQILSLLGHKVQVPREAKARMYNLVKGREAIRPPLANGARTSQPEPVTKPIQPWVAPEPLHRNWLDRFGLLAGCLALMALLCWSAYMSLKSTPIEYPSLPIAQQSGPAATVGEQETRGKVAAKERMGVDGVEAATKLPEPKEEPEPALPKVDLPTPAAERSAEAKAEEPAIAKSSPDTKTPSRSRSIPKGSAGLADNVDGVLLRFSSEMREWERIGESTALNPGDRLLSLSPFRAHLLLGKGSLAMVGETELIVLSKGEEEDPAFDLVRGRVVIDRSPTPIDVKVSFAERQVAIDRPSGALFGMERAGLGRPGEAASQSPGLAILSSDGEIIVTLGPAKETLSQTGAILADAAGKLQLRPVAGLPAWVSEREDNPELEKERSLFVKAFSQGRPVLADIVAATEDSQPAVKTRAIQAVKALGDLSLLTPILDRAGDPLARRATIAALRDVLAQGPQAARRLHGQLQQDFGEATGQTIEQLLIGYPTADAGRAETLQRLVDLLSSRIESVGVRELALDNLRRLTGKDEMGYDPDHPGPEATSRWKALIPKGDTQGVRRKAAQ